MANDWKELNKKYLEQADAKLAIIRGENNLKSVGPLPDDTRIYKSLRSYLNSNGELTVNDPYEKSVWVFAAINAKLQNISGAPLCLYKDVGPNKIKKEVDEGDLYNLFMSPNKYMTNGELIRSTVGFLELYGEAFWIIERKNITEVPKEIYCFNSERFSPWLNKDKKWNGGWVYTPKGSKGEQDNYYFFSWEIIQFKYFNPYDDIRGLSPINASKLGVEQDYFASQYNKNFFKDGAAIGGMISVPDALSQEQFNRILDQFNERHQGYNRSHKIALIEGDAKFVEAGMSQRDMEFISLKNVTRNEILAAFKTNEVVLGLFQNMQSYEGVKQAHKSFWQETLIPICKLIEDKLWSDFFSKLSSTKGKIWAAFDTGNIDCLREDYELKTKMAKTLFEIGFPINEINKRLDLGFPAFPWGNTWFVKTGVVPVEYVMKPPEDEKEEEKIDEEPEENKPEEDKEKKLDKIIWNNFKTKQTPIENISINKLKRIFFEQRKRVLQNISGNKEIIFDKENEIIELKKILNIIYTLSINLSMELLEEELVYDVIEKDDEIKDFIKNRSEFISLNIISTIEKGIDKIEKENDNNYNKVEEIKKFYNKLANRIRVMARTEVNSVINGIKFIYLNYIGINYIKWISKGDESRESHKKFNGKIVKLGESFSDEFTIRYPLDIKAPINEIIGCSCYFIPIIKGE